VSKRLSAMNCNAVRRTGTVSETGPVLKFLYTPWNIKKKKNHRYRSLIFWENTVLENTDPENPDSVPYLKPVLC
jgi:hypothetical protein